MPPVSLTEPMDVDDEEEEEEPEAPPEPGDWSVWVTTGGNEGAGTTNPVLLSVYGEDKVFRDIELNTENYVKPKDQDQEEGQEKSETVLFDRGNTDEFKVRNYCDLVVKLN